MIEKILKQVEKDEPRINGLSAEAGHLSDDTLTKEIYEIIKIKTMREYEEALDTVSVFIHEEEGKELSNVALKFAAEKNNNAYAWANSHDSEITFNLCKMLEPQILLVAIHELAHIICSRYIRFGMQHCLEFAIICYCIQYKSRARTEDFFRAYDIREEISKPFLSINSVEFDSLITCLNWNSLRELAEKSVNLANQIRKRAVPHNIY